LGRLDTGSKPDALPLGYAPKYRMEPYNKRGFYPLTFTNAMRFYVTEAEVQKIEGINIVYQRIYFPLFDK